MNKRSPISRLWDAGIGFDGSPLPGTAREEIAPMRAMPVWITQLEVWWLQWRYSLKSGADVSKSLNGAVASARIRGANWKDAKPESGLYGRTHAEARLNALRFWVWKYAEKRNQRIDAIAQSRQQDNNGKERGKMNMKFS